MPQLRSTAPPSVGRDLHAAETKGSKSVLEEVEVGASGVAVAGEVLVLFSKVHRVVSAAIRSRF